MVFKKGQVAWNRGNPVCCNTGRTHFKKGQVGKNAGHWQGGRKKDVHGYILIHKPKHPFCDKRGYVREHRLVMEKHLGHYLKPEEKTHHINGIKSDNRIENFMLFSSQGYHTAFHRWGYCNPKNIIFNGGKK